MTTPATEPATAAAWPPDPYDKALAAEPRLRHLERMVEAFVALAPAKRSRVPMCVACIWELILKPLALPLVGWDRGTPVDQAPEVPRDSWKPLDLAALLAQPDGTPPPTSSTEAWLRTSEAFDVVTNRWLSMLDAADPGNGHGIGRQVTTRTS